MAATEGRPGNGGDSLVSAARFLERYLADLVAFEGPDFVLPAGLEDAEPSLPEATVAASGKADASGELEAFRAEICNCTACPLGHSRQNFVFGSGNPGAGIMFVGEAPGAEEDRQGLPFVGEAGRLLTRIIEAMRLRREDVYICNVLKCRPPNNRDPQPEEVDQCEPYLKRQIAIVQPRIICALGRVASQALLRTTAPLGSLRRTLHQYEGIPVIVTYHPAALLRNEGYKRPTWEDVKWLRRQYDGVEL